MPPQNLLVWIGGGHISSVSGIRQRGVESKQAGLGWQVGVISFGIGVGLIGAFGLICEIGLKVVKIKIERMVAVPRSRKSIMWFWDFTKFIIAVSKQKSIFETDIWESKFISKCPFVNFDILI